jgi:type I restriction enzyme S subunit
MAAFDDRTRSLYQRIVLNERETRTLDALRDALLPKLLSGEVRVNRAEQMTEAVS